MQIINTMAALDGLVDVTLRPIVARFADAEMMELATIFIVGPGDTLDTLAMERGWPCECWEFITDHGGWLEGVFIISDDGAGQVVLVPDRADTDPDLLALFKANAEQADD